MAQNGKRRGFYIVGEEIIPAVHSGHSARNEKKSDRRARTRSKRNSGPIAGAADERNHIGVERRLDSNRINFSPCLGKQRWIQGRERNPVKMARVKSLRVLRDDLNFFLVGGIGDANLEKKTIQLRFRKRICSLKFDWILRGKDSEISWKGITHSVDGHLPLFHSLEERRLSARRSAIDLIHQEKVREDGAAVQRERIRAQVEDVRARHVGGHQIRRALDALESEPANARERFYGERFRKSRNALDYGMPVAYQDKEELVHHFVLPDDDLRHFCADVFREIGKVLHD